MIEGAEWKREAVPEEDFDLDTSAESIAQYILDREGVSKPELDIGF
jgi:hypothetical protein